jgi:hypothetical protein
MQRKRNTVTAIHFHFQLHIHFLFLESFKLRFQVATHFVHPSFKLITTHFILPFLCSLFFERNNQFYSSISMLFLYNEKQLILFFLRQIPSAFTVSSFLFWTRRTWRTTKFWICKNKYGFANLGADLKDDVLFRIWGQICNYGRFCRLMEKK